MVSTGAIIFITTLTALILFGSYHMYLNYWYLPIGAYVKVGYLFKFEDGSYGRVEPSGKVVYALPYSLCLKRSGVTYKVNPRYIEWSEYYLHEEEMIADNGQWIPLQSVDTLARPEAAHIV